MSNSAFKALPKQDNKQGNLLISDGINSSWSLSASTFQFSNIDIGISTSGTSATNVITQKIGNAPSEITTDSVKIWVENYGADGTAALVIKSEDNHKTTIGTSLKFDGTDVISTLNNKLNNNVTINGKPVSSSPSLTYTDVSAVPTSRKINNQPLTGDITIDAALPSQTSASGKFLTSNGTYAYWEYVSSSGAASGGMPLTVTINGKAVSGNPTLNFYDVNALAASGTAVSATNATSAGFASNAHTVDGLHSSSFVQTSRTVNNQSLSANIVIDAAGVSAVPLTRTVNNQSLSANITLDASSVNAVPLTRTVNNQSLSANIVIDAAGISAVPLTRTVNGKALSANITLIPGDLTALPASATINGKALSGNPTLTTTDVGAVPTSRKVNSQALTADIVISAASMSALPNTATINGLSLSANPTLNAYNVNALPISTTLNNKALSGNTSITASDIGAVSIYRKINNYPLTADININATSVGAVPTSRTINGYALTSDATLIAGDVNALPLSGGTITGNLTVVTTSGGLTAKSSSNNYLEFGTWSGSADEIKIQMAADVNGTYPVKIGSRTNTKVALTVNDLPAVLIDTSGNVGIGNPQPPYKCTVAGTLGILEGGSNPTYYTVFQGGDQLNNITYTLPTAAPSANGLVLVSNTAGVMAWSTPPGNVSVTNDVSAADIQYVSFSRLTTGAISNIYTASSKAYFVPANGTLSCTQFTSLSDVNFKTDIHDIQNSSELIKSLRGVSFLWKDTAEKSYGLIAQEVEQIIPEAVSEYNDVKSVNYNMLIAFLIESNKELLKRIEILEGK